jgi:SecD/SecF fusion protein
MTDSEVQKVIKRKVDESVESAGVLRKRIDQFGVTQPNIQKLGSQVKFLLNFRVQMLHRAKRLLSVLHNFSFGKHTKLTK